MVVYYFWIVVVYVGLMVLTGELMMRGWVSILFGANVGITLTLVCVFGCGLFFLCRYIKDFFRERKEKKRLWELEKRQEQES